MREFAKGLFKLRSAPRSLRLVYGAFLILAGLGFLTQLGFQLGRIGITPLAVAIYYRGDERGVVMAFPKSFGQMLEITHAHAFMMAVVFLILAHLFASTSGSPQFKGIVLGLTFAGTLGDLLAPWLIRYSAAWWAWFGLAAWIAQGAGNLVLVAVSGWECLGPDLSRGGGGL